jgi:hypothetical protein
MELLLNIFATVTILALVVIWREHWFRQSRPGVRNTTRECLAVCCLSILTFFAISMTDDLQCDLTVLEECSIKRVNAVVFSAGHHSHREKINIHPASIAILADAFSLDLPFLAAGLDPSIYFSTHFLLLHLLPNRAPPFST